MLIKLLYYIGTSHCSNYNLFYSVMLTKLLCYVGTSRCSNYNIFYSVVLTKLLYYVDTSRCSSYNIYLQSQANLLSHCGIFDSRYIALSF